MQQQFIILLTVYISYNLNWINYEDKSTFGDTGKDRYAMHFFTTDYVSVTALQFLGVIVHVVSDVLFLFYITCQVVSCRESRRNFCWTQHFVIAMFGKRVQNCCLLNVFKDVHTFSCDQFFIFKYVSRDIL